jgi:hypothetical protein
MKQIIRINAEYEFTEEETKQWLEATDDARTKRIEETKGCLLEEFDEFEVLDVLVDVK